MNSCPRNSAKYLFAWRRLCVRAGLCLILSILVVIPSSCQSFKGEGTTGSYRSTNSTEFSFANIEQREVFGRAMGLGANRKSASSVLQCTQLSDDLHRCLLRMRAEESGILKAPVPLDPNTADRFWAYVIGLRSELAESKTIAADFECEVNPHEKGKSDEEAGITCRVKYPRLTNEALFSGIEAQDIVNALDSGKPLAAGVSVHKGSVSCLWPSKESGATCQAFPGVSAAASGGGGGMILSKSAKIGADIERTVIDYLTMTNAKAGRDFVNPGTLTGLASCIVDPLPPASSGIKTRRMTCRIAVNVSPFGAPAAH